MQPDSNVGQSIALEMVKRCINKLDLRKAAEPDDPSREHSKYAHPSSCCALCQLLE